MRHLPYNFRIRRIARIYNGERHGRGAEVGKIEIASVFEQLHPVAVAIEIIVCHQSDIPTFTFGLDRFDFSSHKCSRLKLLSAAMAQRLRPYNVSKRLLSTLAAHGDPLRG